MGLRLGQTVGGRLLAVILILALAPAAAIAGIFYLDFSKSLHEDGMEKLILAAEKYAEGIDLWLAVHQRTVETLAALPAAKSLSLSELVPTMKEFAAKDPESEFYFVAKLDGTRWLTDGSTDNISDREYFQRFLKEKATVWSKADFSKVTGNPRVIIVAPIKAPDGSVVGLAGKALSLLRLADYVSKLKIGKTGYPYIVDAEGLCLAHPVKENVLKLNITRSGSETLDRAAKNMLSQKRTVERYVWQGVDKYVASAPVATTGWLVVTTEPISEFLYRIMVATCVALAVLGAVAAAATLLGLLLSRQIARPMAALARQAEVLATGNLTAEPGIQGFGEVRNLSESLVRVTQGLRSIVASVKESVGLLERVVKEVLDAASTTSQAAQQVADSVGQISAGAEETSANAGAISQATAETAARMERLSARVAEISRLTAESKDRTREGAQAMERLARALEEAARQGELTRQAMEELTRKTGQVRDIAGVITGIAEQTNLLALNAAIEAARAGEHGRGFAVVAEEVRKLAEEANRRAEDIAELTQEVGQDIERAASAVVSTAELLEEQKRLGQEASGRFAEIAESAASIAGFLEEVRGEAAAIKEKDAEIARQVNGIAAATEESAASAQEIAASTEEMNAAASALEGSARHLSELFEGLKAASDRFTV